MPEAITPAQDFIRICGRALKSVSFRRKDPAADNHAAAVPVRGIRDDLRAEMRPVGGGEVRVTASTWYVAQADLATRPTLESLLVDGGDTWVIERVKGDVPGPRWVCEVILA